MPLIVMTGFPCSGKSQRSLELKRFFQSAHPDKKVVIVADDQFPNFDREVVYSSSKEEKNLRGFLKSEVQKHLQKDVIVILDSLNYIKGYRYELYCVTRSAQTPHCVIWCDINQERAKTLNEEREGDKYSEKLLEELIMRYEEPISRNRWDFPLYVVQYEDTLQFSNIEASLFSSKPPPPNQSTVAQPLQPTNFMYELDKVTKDIVKHIIAQQKTAVPGETITLPNATSMQLTRHFTLAELNKNRRQFISYMKMNPVTDNTKLSNMFVQYLLKALN